MSFSALSQFTNQFPRAPPICQKSCTKCRTKAELKSHSNILHHLLGVCLWAEGQQYNWLKMDRLGGDKGHENVAMQVPSPAAQLTKVLAGLRHTFVVADATLPDCPLVFASDG